MYPDLLKYFCAKLQCLASDDFLFASTMKELSSSLSKMIKANPTLMDTDEGFDKDLKSY